MEKLKLFNQKKISEEKLKTNNNNLLDDNLLLKESNTPNKLPPNKTRTHIKIKSRDVIQDVNLRTENNVLYNIRKPYLRQNRTLNNLRTLKLNKEKKL